MSEFSSSFLDRTERQSAYDEAAAEASGQDQESIAQWNEQIRKFEKEKEEKDLGYDQIKQTLELLGLPLTEEAVKKFSKVAYEKFKGKVTKTARSFVDKYGEQAKAKLKEGLAAFEAKGGNISDAQKKRLLDSVDELNKKRRGDAADDDENRRTTQQEGDSSSERLSEESRGTNSRVAAQQGLDLGRDLSRPRSEAAAAQFEGSATDKQGKKVRTRKGKSRVGEEPDQVRPRGSKAPAENRNFRGLPKAKLSDAAKARLAEGRAAARERNARRKAGIPVIQDEPLRPVTTEQDLAAVRQLTSEPKQEPIKLGDEDYQEISPRSFFQNTSGVSPDVRERLSNPYSLKNMLGADQAEEALSSFREYKTKAEQRAAQAAKAAQDRKSALARGGASEVEPVEKAPSVTKKLNPDSLYPMREFSARLDKHGAGSAKFNDFEKASSLSEQRQEKVNLE